MHRTPAEWSQMQPSAVLAGSPAQGLNVLTMARDDIVSLGRALEAIMVAAEDRDIDACHELARKALREHDLMQPPGKEVSPMAVMEWNRDVRSAIYHHEETVLIAVRSIACDECMTTLGTLCWEPYERDDGETDDDIDGYFVERDGVMGMWCWHGEDGYLRKREIAAWMPLPPSFKAKKE